MKLNCLVRLLFLFSAVTGFSDVFAQVGDIGSTNSEVLPWEIDKQSDFEAIKAKAENGDAIAQYKLGVCYDTGKVVTKDDSEAIKWFRKAAEQNNSDAECNLGLCYANGEGANKDVVEAVKWYRKAAEQNNPAAQCLLGGCYLAGEGVTKDVSEAITWYRKAGEQNFMMAELALACFYAEGKIVKKDQSESVKWWRRCAEQGSAPAQFYLGGFYLNGDGVKQDYAEAIKWYRRAAEQEYVQAQCTIGKIYLSGNYVAQDYKESAKWLKKAANHGFADAEIGLGLLYFNGYGVAQDYVEAHKWCNLAAAQGNRDAKKILDILARRMTPSQIAKAQELASEFKPREESNSSNSVSSENPTATGTGFFITDDGCLISNYHVVKDAAKVRLLTGTGLIDATVVKVDAANDLALLKATGKFSPLPIAASRTVKLGATVATVGFPDTGLQGFSPKLAKGEIGSLAGASDDPRYFQISVPVQPGNSGGALVDARGNVVGIVAAKLSAKAALDATGALPENVNYAVKSSLLLSFLESVPEVSAKLKEPNTKDEAFEDVVKSAQDAAVLVLVY
jgi:TPR repeat protein